MTYNHQPTVDCTIRDLAERSQYSLEIENELERLDREAGRDYLPMDVYVDPRTMNRHFQDASIRARRAQIHLGAPRTH